MMILKWNGNIEHPHGYVMSTSIVFPVDSINRIGIAVVQQFKDDSSNPAEVSQLSS